MKQKIKSQYEIDAENTLDEMGVTFTPVYLGHTFTKWQGTEEKDRLTRATWDCTFSRAGKSFSIHFYESIVCSYGTYRDFKGREQMDYDKKIAPKPSAYSVVACIQKYDPGTLANFCSDFGYSADSRKALGTYLAVQEEWTKVQRFFTQTELERLQEIN